MSLILSGTDGLSDVDGTAATPAIRGTDANTGIFFPAADTIAFSEGGVEIARFDSSGNLGIGTASPTTKLNVSSAGADVEIRASTTTSGNVRFGFDADGAYYNWIQTNRSSGAIQFAISNSEVMRLDASGRLGIGVTSPTYPLQIQAITGGSAIKITGRASPADGYADISLQNNAGTVTHAFFDASNAGVFFGSGTTIPLQFYINSAEVGRFDSSGNLMVGATAAINGAKLTVQSTGSAGIATGYGTTAGQWRRMYVETTNNNLYFYNGSNEGYLNTAGAWINASDARLKNSIVDIKYGLSAVMNTQPRSYKMNDLDGDYVGFVAQELQQIIPEVVSGNPERQLGVDYGSLVAVAFKAIQEQQALITSLTARITALEGA